MEKVQETVESVEVYENDIDMYLKRFIQEQNIEDMRQAHQSVWNAALIYIYRHAFKGTNRLKLNRPLEGYVNNNYNNKYNNLNNSNCNGYNIDYINLICDYYIYICYMYNKEISIVGFTKLTGIDDNTIYAWGKQDNRSGTSASEIYKKLSKEREESLTNKLVDSKQAVAQIAILNKYYGWSLPGVTKENTKTIKTAADLPRLNISDDAQGSNVRQIAQQENIVQDVQEIPQSQ